MKKILKTIGISLGVIVFPIVAWAVQVTVPSAPSKGYALVSTTTGNYIYSLLPSCSTGSSALTFNTTSNGYGCNSITGGSGTGNVSTSTNEVTGGVAYWTSNSGTPALLGQFGNYASNQFSIANAQNNVSAPELTSSNDLTVGVSFAGGKKVNIVSNGRKAIAIPAMDNSGNNIVINDGSNQNIVMRTVAGDDTFNGSTGALSLITPLTISNGGTGLTAVGASSSVLTTDGSITKWNKLTTSQLTNDSGFLTSAVTSFAQTSGAAQTGAVTIGTSSPVTVNGLTFGNSITNSGAAFTLTNTVTGTISVPASGITSGTFGAGNYTFPAVVTIPNASTTLLSASYASSTLYYGANLASCNSASNALTWSAGTFGCNTINGLSWMFQGANNSTSTMTGFSSYLNAGTTTNMLSPFTAATSTNYQIGITSGAGYTGWAFRSDNGGNLIIGTTSATTYATSTGPQALQLNGTGTPWFGLATSTRFDSRDALTIASTTQGTATTTDTSFVKCHNQVSITGTMNSWYMVNGVVIGENNPCK